MRHGKQETPEREGRQGLAGARHAGVPPLSANGMGACMSLSCAPAKLLAFGSEYYEGLPPFSVYIRLAAVAPRRR